MYYSSLYIVSLQREGREGKERGEERKEEKKQNLKEKALCIPGRGPVVLGAVQEGPYVSFGPPRDIDH